MNFLGKPGIFDIEVEHMLVKLSTQLNKQGVVDITIEHILNSLLTTASVTETLTACDADIAGLKKSLHQHLTTIVPNGDKQTVNKLASPNKACQRVMQRAIFNIHLSGQKTVHTSNLLLAIYSEHTSYAAKALNNANVTRLKLINYLNNTSTFAMQQSKQLVNSPGLNFLTQQSESTSDPISQYCVNLNEKVNSNTYDPLIGRVQEVNRVIQILCRRRKNNPLLLGDPGVGKTAIAEGLAYHIVKKTAPKAILKSTVYSLDLGSLLAGTKYRGDFEKRLKSVLGYINKDPGAILFIDEIHTIIGAGATAGGAMDASNLIKPLLSSGELRCMGSTTHQEYREVFAKDKALVRRYQTVEIKEASIEETINILMGLRSAIEQYHGVTFTKEALIAAVELSNRYINDRCLPDKALDVVDEVGAYFKIDSSNKKTVSVNDIEYIISKIARIPVAQMSKNEKHILQNLAADLKAKVYGQDVAIDKLSAAIRMSKSGLKDPRKPVGSFIFAGPTGVGKTEITRELAKLLGIELIRLDMSEYMEKHSVSRLIGSPPGYVGHEQGGILTELVHKKPYSIVLLDEIEKAHHDIYNILLQIMDNGVLTDSSGRKIDFRHTIVIMTTNAGAADLEKNSIGFYQDNETVDRATAINNLFTPEFRNRVDAIVQFNHLSTDDIQQVLNKFLLELSDQLQQKKVYIKFSKVAKAWLCKLGYNKKLGARPMARLIQEYLKSPLADEILFGKLQRGGQVVVGMSHNHLKFNYNKNELCTI